MAYLVLVDELLVLGHASRLHVIWVHTVSGGRLLLYTTAWHLLDHLVQIVDLFGLHHISRHTERFLVHCSWLLGVVLLGELRVPNGILSRHIVLSLIRSEGVQSFIE